MDTNIKNRKEQDIVYLMEYLYEEAFMLDREVIGEAHDYIEFLGYAYSELEKQDRKQEFVNIVKPFISDSIINSEVLTATLLYLNFNALYKKEENQVSKVKVFSMRKVV